ncbi:MAG: hypothetical protein JO154_22700 [Chitinophaga sp.]|uniref:hypothetical protein n=1 Tax=Chitinophaga sp. TaxID=1869181 RepID=UPI0025C5A552|nr:hypothetical protein [Chitinophaga sp.]MBV8255427.1 hypothetical protein [Chitinophaga sp.]
MRFVNLLLLILVIATVSASAQTIQNIPNPIDVTSNGRDYYVNKPIPGWTRDSEGPDYILLHEAYTNVLLEDHHVMGKISAIRGNPGAFNRKVTLEVNTASAYNGNQGTILCYNEFASLVLLTHAGKRYIAVELANSSTLSDISFTGYAKNETLAIAYGNTVSDVQPFNKTTPIYFPQSVSIGKYTESPAPASLSISGGPIWSMNYWMKAIKLTESNAMEFAGETNSYGIGAAGPNLYFFTTNPQGQGYVKYYQIVNGEGEVGMGMDPVAGYKLLVNGTLGATKIKVKQGNWSDFVFQDNYQLPSLAEVEAYVREHKHLPNIPTEKEVVENGIDVGDMNKKLLQKIEEMTLYMIEMKKDNEQLKARVEVLEGKKK